MAKLIKVREKSLDKYITEKIDVIQNALLGEYQDETYLIPKHIIKELVAVEKTKRNTYGNSILCSAIKLGYGEIVFEITIDKNEDNTATAKLFVLESVLKINGYYENTIKTQIGEFKARMTDFINTVYEKFNVRVKTDKGEGKLTDDKFINSFTFAKKQMSLVLDKITQEKMQDLFSKLYHNKLAILRDLNNEFSNVLLDTIEFETDKINDMFLKKNNYKSLNEIVDKCYENISGVRDDLLEQEQEYNLKLLPMINKLVNDVDTIIESAETKAINLLNPEDKKKIEEMQREENRVKTPKSEPAILQSKFENLNKFLEKNKNNSKNINNEQEFTK